MIKPLNISGNRFGRLVAIEIDHKKRYTYPTYWLTTIYWKCKCDCGNETIVPSKHLQSGRTVSCGCAAKENAKTHGLSNMNVYRIWSSMKSRSLNKKVLSNLKLKCYADVGISEDWLSFENFYRDMGNPPSREYEIDRINPWGNYEKINCRWVTHSENMLNQRRNRETYSIYKELKPIIPYKLFRRRLLEGWDVGKAINPKMKNQFI